MSKKSSSTEDRCQGLTQRFQKDKKKSKKQSITKRKGKKSTEVKFPELKKSSLHTDFDLLVYTKK